MAGVLCHKLCIFHLPAKHKFLSATVFVSCRNGDTNLDITEVIKDKSAISDQHSTEENNFLVADDVFDAFIISCSHGNFYHFVLRVYDEGILAKRQQTSDRKRDPEGDKRPVPSV